MSPDVRRRIRSASGRTGVAEMHALLDLIEESIDEERRLRGPLVQRLDGVALRLGELVERVVTDPLEDEDD